MEENNLYSGGPGITNEEQTTETQTQTQVQSQPIYLGGRKFESTEDLINYTQQLEGKMISSQLENEVPQAIQNANKIKPSQLIYEDPDAFYQLTKEEAVNEALSIFTKRNAEQKLWDNFFATNKDLAEDRELIEFQLQKNQSKYKNLPAEEGLAKIGNEVRTYKNKIRGSVQGGKELPSGPAMVAGSSNGVTATQVSVKSEPVDFVSQIRRMQKRGR